MKTERGIFYNLEESTYTLNYNEYIFYFSSELYLNKFKDTVEEFINYETLKLKNRYKCYLNLRSMLLISYYKRIEKRGFYILVNCGMENDYIKLEEDTVFKIGG